MRGYVIQTLLYIAAYVLPAAIIWGILGAFIQALNGVALIVAVVIVCYSMIFGGCEVLQIPFRQLGLLWQVPSEWLKGRSVTLQTLIWGVCLGPGFVTRNPYAGMWVLPALLALAPNLMVGIILGIAIGIAHGGGRAIGVLRNRRKSDQTCTPIMVLELMRWKFFDGFMLMLIAGGLITYILTFLA